MKPLLYLETTVISYFCSRPNRDIVISARQQLTHLWWDSRINDFDPYVSDLVYEEIQRGDKNAAKIRLASINRFKIVEIDDDVRHIAELLVRHGAIPKKFIEDALHIAAATANGMDYILTWNFTHINNAEKRERISRIIEEIELVCPIICTPEELLGG
jgi:predicted nucleic acid-binding protein